jgi:hypothetical protein
MSNIKKIIKDIDAYATIERNNNDVLIISNKGADIVKSLVEKHEDVYMASSNCVMIVNGAKRFLLK